MHDVAAWVVVVAGTLVLIRILVQLVEVARLAWARSLPASEDDSPIKCCHECWQSFNRDDWFALRREPAKEGLDARRCSCGAVLELSEADRDDCRPYTGYRGFQ